MSTLAPAVTGSAVPRPPSAVALARARAALELRLFFRESEQVIFSFAYPLIMLAIFATVFGDERVSGDVSFQRYFLAGIAATGIMLTSFQAVGTTIAEERDQGLLARLQTLGTPPVAYFGGKAGQVLVTTVAQLALLLTLAATMYDVPLPSEPSRWLTFGWVVLLGSLAGTVLGVAASSLGRSARSVSAGISSAAIVLQFVSGVFFVYSELPPWMQQIAAVFPLKWLTQGMRSVFLPDGAAVAEPAGSWEHGTTAVVLAAWVIIGVVICARTFRWRRDAG